MRVLISPASVHGATAEIGRSIAATLRENGIDADVTQPELIHDLHPYGGVILGSAIYGGRWKLEALAFIEEHARAIAALPCWIFSSGPITANEPSEPLEANHEAELLALTGAREHRLFGGALDLERLSPTEQGVARWVNVVEGDARDWHEVEAWASRIVAELTSAPLEEIPTPATQPLAFEEER